MEGEAKIQEEAKEKGSEKPKQTGKARVTRPPHNYMAIMKDSVVPIQIFPLDKLCDQLYDGVVLHKEERERASREEYEVSWLQKYWVDKSLNKNCFLLFAREFEVAWGHESRHWEWKPVKESGNVDVEVAELRGVNWLEINGKFRTIILSPNTLYEVSLVALMTESSQGWGAPVNINITFLDKSSPGLSESFQHIPRGKWTNILMGEFTTSSENIGEITFRIYECSPNWKQGLVVKGVAFQPKN